MIRSILATFLLLTGIARADTYDYVIMFASETAAKADATVGQYFVGGAGGGWRADVTIPNVAVTQVTGSQAIPNLSGIGTINVPVQTPYAGWFILIATQTPNPALQALAGCVVAAHREAGTAFFTAPSYTPIVSPIFAGSTYAFGHP